VSPVVHVMYREEEEQYHDTSQILVLVLLEYYLNCTARVLSTISVSMLSRFRSLRACTFATSAPLNALSATARPRAEQLSSEWKGTSATGGNTTNFIGGEFVQSKSSEWHDILDPVSFLPSH